MDWCAMSKPNWLMPQESAHRLIRITGLPSQNSLAGVQSELVCRLRDWWQRVLHQLRKIDFSSGFTSLMCVGFTLVSFAETATWPDRQVSKSYPMAGEMSPLMNCIEARNNSKRVVTQDWPTICEKNHWSWNVRSRFVHWFPFNIECQSEFKSVILVWSLRW